MTTFSPSRQTAAVTVYTKPACVQCNMTKRWLDMRGIAYTAVDMSEDATAFDFVTRALGAQQAPVVVTSADGEIDHWTGFQPDRLAELIPADGDAA